MILDPCIVSDSSEDEVFPCFGLRKLPARALDPEEQMASQFMGQWLSECFQVRVGYRFALHILRYAGALNRIAAKPIVRILLVEDNRTLAEWLARTLRKDKYVVECVHNGSDADHQLRTQTYDLVILDLSLPRMDGREVLKRLRGRNNNVPVLILTATNTIEGRVVGLDHGADDYVAKPFDIAELEARIRALMRRTGQSKNPVLRCGSLHYDSNSRIFSLGDHALSLTPREHAVLEALTMKMGKTVSKQSLADSLFTIDDNVSPDVIEIYVHRLRKKLESGDVAIVTLRGLGYLLKQRHDG